MLDVLSIAKNMSLYNISEEDKAILLKAFAIIQREELRIKVLREGGDLNGLV